MNCQQRRLQITALLDGALEPSQEAGLESHLEKCPGCHRFLDEQSELDLLLDAAGLELEPPPRIWNQIEAKVAVVPGPGLWERALGSLWDLIQVPVLRHALAGLLLMTLFSLSLLNLPRAEDRVLLSRLDSYRVEVPRSNPFLPQDRVAWNPFFQGTESAGNPFDNARSPR